MAITDDSDVVQMLTFYNSFDSDKNGLIDYKEFCKLVQALGSKTDDDKRREGFKNIDIDRNGYIDFDEFIEWWGNN